MSILPFKIEELLSKIDSPLITKTDNKYQDLIKARCFDFGKYVIYLGSSVNGWFIKCQRRRENYNFKRKRFEDFSSENELSEFYTDIFSCLEKVKELIDNDN